jgi:hypothetical protein
MVLFEVIKKGGVARRVDRMDKEQIRQFGCRLGADAVSELDMDIKPLKNTKDTKGFRAFVPFRAFVFQTALHNIRYPQIRAELD